MGQADSVRIEPEKMRKWAAELRQKGYWIGNRPYSSNVVHLHALDRAGAINKDTWNRLGSAAKPWDKQASMAKVERQYFCREIRKFGQEISQGLEPMKFAFAGLDMKYMTATVVVKPSLFERAKNWILGLFR